MNVKKLLKLRQLAHKHERHMKYFCGTVMDSYGACIRGPLIQSLDTTTTCMYYVLDPKVTLGFGYEANIKK